MELVQIVIILKHISTWYNYFMPDLWVFYLKSWLIFQGSFGIASV